MSFFLKQLGNIFIGQVALRQQRVNLIGLQDFKITPRGRQLLLHLFLLLF